MTEFTKAFVSGEGSKWGVSDLYPEREQALRGAIAAGGEFDTGWYFSKKEIWSARISRLNGNFLVEAYCSDDFDTEGTAELLFMAHPGEVYEQVMEKVNEVMQKALADKDENEAFVGFSIHEPADNGGPRGGWIETILLPRGLGEDMSSPPGGLYYEWGVQGEAPVREIPEDTLLKMKEWAQSKVYEKAEGDHLTVGKFTIYPWG